MSTIVCIEHGVTDAAVGRVEQLLQHVALTDPNWNGAEFVIQRADFTDIPDPRDGINSTALLHRVFRAIDGREEV